MTDGRWTRWHCGGLGARWDLSSPLPYESRFESGPRRLLLFYPEQSDGSFPPTARQRVGRAGFLESITQGSAERNAGMAEGDRDLDAGWFFDTTT